MPCFVCFYSIEEEEEHWFYWYVYNVPLTEIPLRPAVRRDCSRMSRNCCARPVCVRNSVSRCEMTRSLARDSSRCRHSTKGPDIHQGK